MASRPTAFMPLWIGDYLADTTHLSPEQHGAYLLLLMAYWRRGGPLPADDQYLCRVVGMTIYKWRGTRPTIAAFFEERDGIWVSKRSDEELVKAEVRYGKRAAAGRKGGSAPKVSGRKIVYAPALATSSALPKAANEAAGIETAENSHQEPSNASPVLEAQLKQSQSQSLSMETRTTVGSSSETLSLVEPLVVSPIGKTPPRPAQKPISSKREKGTRWTAEAVPEDWIVAALKAHPEVDARAEALAFVNFWISCTGANAWKLNWRATFMNWIFREAKEIKRRNGYGRPNGHAQGQLGTTSKFADDLKRELADLDAAERTRAH